MPKSAAQQNEFGSDQLSDPSFEPCRDERCTRQELHPAHMIANGYRGPGRPRKKY